MSVVSKRFVDIMVHFLHIQTPKIYFELDYLLLNITYNIRNNTKEMNHSSFLSILYKQHISKLFIGIGFFS